jgi:hypothetical protein
MSLGIKEKRATIAFDVFLEAVAAECISLRRS